ncbi:MULTISPECIES: ABC transporter substrate-binding protein [unclassified Pseudoclavibacter]|uniref:ABC transporter substrate-binding protein n=1 Tax=unclassified Pseudoclavibacter TaxID=2615177 RepID=UPI001300DDA7|nr:MULTISPECIES: ABC transporter substrate-binding protein [unclassified Pseudoclavibacter]KAB1659171.1 ABC transporter substrate-binding protein [Pseudoclavibacter sp. CFCC 11306]KAB1660832.1 ABC transporter substrate-binding protein [Pseudoclavibacter sp. CFCC 13796]
MNTAHNERNSKMQMKFSRRMGTAVALAFFASAALSACSSSTGETETSPSKEPVVTTPTIISDGKLTVCASFSNPPDNFKNDSNEPDGAEIDIAKAIAGEMGLAVDYKQYSFSGLIPALQASQCDVIMSSLYIKPEREEVVDFVPYLQSGSAVMVSAANAQGVTGYNDTLCGRKVAAANGSTGASNAQTQSGACEAGGKSAIDLTLTENTTDALHQLQAGQVDAVLSTTELVDYYAKKTEGELERAGDSFSPITIGAATQKGSAELHDALSTAFKSIVESGEYGSILDEWGLSETAVHPS